MGKPSTLLLLITNISVSLRNPLPHLFQRLRISRDHTAIPAYFILFVFDVAKGPFGGYGVFVSENEDLCGAEERCQWIECREGDEGEGNGGKELTS